MHILYVDDSGSVSNANERFFVLAGVAAYETGLFPVARDVEECVTTFGLGNIDEIELHATDMYGGRGKPWSAIKSKADREALLQCVVKTLVQQPASVRTFSVAVDKKGVSPADPVALAFEELCNRFNLFMQRDNYRNGRTNRGLIVMDESRHEKPLQALARHFRNAGGKWGNYRFLAEVPLFVDSKATRLMQLADLVAWATFRKYEFSDGRFFDPLIPKFDADGGVIHGLFHARGSNRTERCFCPACLTRDQRDGTG
jgi:Protein of unknown function (DUF3800)